MGGRHGQSEVLEAAPARVEGAPRLDEVEEVLPPDVSRKSIPACGKAIRSPSTSV